MSKHVINFYDMLSKNQALHEKYEACNQDPSKIIELAGSYGFVFSKEEFLDCMCFLFGLDELNAAIEKKIGGHDKMPHPCLP